MTVQEQEALFAEAQIKFPGMTPRWCSGYVAGVHDADREAIPDDPPTLGMYGRGYRQGCIDAIGMDTTHFFPDMVEIGATIYGRWWE